jgi:hypothetical protein
MTTTADTAAEGRALPVPTARQIVHLAFGGLAGLGLWEVFPILAQMITGQGLSPPWLIKLLAANLLGFDLFPAVETWPHLIHIATGAVGYPIAYFVLSRGVRSFGPIADGVIWGVLTTILALGVFAPLAGLPFLLLAQGAGPLTFSLLGHIAYAVAAVVVFERLERRA